MERNREHIPYLHNGKIIMVPVLTEDEVTELAQKEEPHGSE